MALSWAHEPLQPLGPWVLGLPPSASIGEVLVYAQTAVSPPSRPLGELILESDPALYWPLQERSTESGPLYVFDTVGDLASNDYDLVTTLSTIAMTTPDMPNGDHAVGGFTTITTTPVTIRSTVFTTPTATLSVRASFRVGDMSSVIAGTI